jgi:hypothetical protein
MDERVQHALACGRTIDITTRGRKSRRLRRTQIWFHHIDGLCISRGLRVAVTGMPTYWRTPSSPLIPSKA